MGLSTLGNTVDNPSPHPLWVHKSKLALVTPSWIFMSIADACPQDCRPRFCKCFRWKKVHYSLSEFSTAVSNGRNISERPAFGWNSSPVGKYWELQVRNSLQLTFALILKRSKHEVLTVSVPQSHVYPQTNCSPSGCLSNSAWLFNDMLIRH